MTVSIRPLFTGLSTDTKPNGAIGSLFYEQDTGALYVRGGGITWTDVSTAGSVALAAAVAAITLLTDDFETRIAALE